MQHPVLHESTIPLDAPVVLDCDGLLVNTQHAWDRAYTTLFARYGVQLNQADRASFIGMELAPIGKRLAELLAPCAPPEHMGAEVLQLMQEHLGSGLAPMPGAVELVQALAGRRPLAVASNAPTTTVIAYLEKFFDLSAFTAIIGGDKAAAPKPAPDLYIAACTALQVEPRSALALEDSPTGAAAALAAGLYVIGIPSTSDLTFPCHLRVPALTTVRLRRALALGQQHA
ncbi:HAD family phosphatase (plasmid) [Kitasatospora sp. NBC_00374]|uniref:HAD family hydrolase n=1 Tax=Kitasatospora sp. NBC_00374 TaxID=2975964 RepID=UPI003253B20F